MGYAYPWTVTRGKVCGDGVKKYIANEKCICYNASRQREVNSPCNLTINIKNPRAATLGFSILFLMAEQIHRLVTDYLSLSNHLMMQWQITPPTTVTIREVRKSKWFTSFLLPVLEAVTHLYYHTLLSISICIFIIPSPFFQIYPSCTAFQRLKHPERNR